jgi:predicted nucleic acid-binding Zn ribbon protein
VPSTPDISGRVGDTILSVMKKLGLEDRFWEQSLVSEWSTLVGEQVARHTRPGRIQQGTLHVFVTNSAWLHELMRYGQRPMLENIQRRFGREKIRSLRLQADPDAGRR